MDRYNMVKQQFLKNWMRGLVACNPSLRVMSIKERKLTIKLSADIAMAATRSGATIWSRALLSRATVNTSQRLLVRRILRKYRYYPKNVIRRPSKNGSRLSKRVRKGRKMSKIRFLGQENALEKRTEMLKNLVPGGHLMDGKCLIEETLDYVVHLQAQVDAMRTITADFISCGHVNK
ncbi:PREDICTED: transcription factor IBH1 isoform X2 [Tarenaya hassleriana]|nr:PREDICTED: transcription factor IBH1 isoform X2 [Tarenaya hassleriana]